MSSQSPYEIELEKLTRQLAANLKVILASLEASHQCTVFSFLWSSTEGIIQLIGGPRANE